MSKEKIEPFMNPRSVAVIGASRKTGRGSFNVIENMLDFGYRGKIYPVNPMAGEIAGIRAFPDVKEIKEPVDLAIINTPRKTIPPILKQCASQGIKSAVIIPQGFSDSDEKGNSLQLRLTEIAGETGIRLLGPNTLGVINAFSGFTSSFMPLKREIAPVGVVCQSGIFFVGSSLFTGIMGKGIDLGNSCDLDFSDAVEYFGEDDDIEVIFLHIEGMNDGRRFLETAERVSRRKPIVSLKTARSEMGARAAASHSGSMVGSHEVFESAFRQTGIISTSDPEDILDFTKALLNLPPMKGNRVAIVTFTGAGGIILIDDMYDQGLEPARLSPYTITAIKDLSPSWMPIGNPVDIWPAVMKNSMDHVYSVALEAVLEDPNVDGVICIAIAPELPENSYLDATGTIRYIASKYREKPVVAWLYGPEQKTVSRKLERDGHVVSLPSLPRAVRTLGALYRRHLFLEGLAV